ncbi:MAG: DNA polymerase III subunit epsilon [Gammaproteobacteria bacterium]|nr:MAG: DNA polymerase III subunit epsilon [Gammaproteobacteria bacterium]
MWQGLARKRYQKRVQGTALAQCWSAAPKLNKTDWRDTTFLVADGEMSSLHVNDGELLSLGWVPLKEGRIVLSESRHILINSDASVGDSATIHQIRDCELSDGASAKMALDEFLRAAEGAVLVFHHALLDIAFLDKLSKQVYGAPLLLPVLDTLQIDLTRLKRRNETPEKGALGLQGCRKRYSLPQYPAHNALMDAVATAELLLAQIKHRAHNKALPLSALNKTS